MEPGHYKWNRRDDRFVLIEILHDTNRQAWYRFAGGHTLVRWREEEDQWLERMKPDERVVYLYSTPGVCD